MKLIIVFFCSLTILCLVNAKTRIVGGGFAEEHEFPHQIALLYKGSFRCGGSIVGSVWVLTAAHCVVKGRKILKNLSILAGTNSLSYGGVKRDVVETIVHNKYANKLNDVALMRLKEYLMFDFSIQPIEIATKKIPAGAQVVITGWGKISGQGQASNNLKKNTLRKLSSNDCASSLGISHPGLICLGHSRNNGACFGDSGGSAVYRGKLVGVANFIVGTCGTSKPDAYANVRWYIKWIYEHISKYDRQRNLKNLKNIAKRVGFNWHFPYSANFSSELQ